MKPRPGYAERMEAMSKGGVVQVVSVPQLFPTPLNVAARMVELAEIEPCHDVLEPSAGTGVLLDAVGVCNSKFGVEIDWNLCEALARRFGGENILQGDFLEIYSLGKFHRILMNPPFKNGIDVKHIEHALTMLQPSGRLVAICADGPRQNKALRARSSHWEQLPPGTFDDTNVASVLLVIEGE